MSVSGNIYGVVLNDRAELERLAPLFREKPYLATPKAPVVYMKPRSAIARSAIKAPVGNLSISATLALLMRRDAARVSKVDALGCVGAVCVALDVSLPQESYYRPAVAQMNADGFLGLGEWAPPTYPDKIRTWVDGRFVHEWSLERLARRPADLIADLSAFMTIKAGDVLLVGLPGDAPTAVAGQTVRVEAGELPLVEVSVRA